MQFNNDVKNRLRSGIASPSDFEQLLGAAARNSQECDAIIDLEMEGLVAKPSSQSTSTSLVRLLFIQLDVFIHNLLSEYH